MSYLIFRDYVLNTKYFKSYFLSIGLQCSATQYCLSIVNEMYMVLSLPSGLPIHVCYEERLTLTQAILINVSEKNDDPK